jgi:plasmid stabilization system protein ParE
MKVFLSELAKTKLLNLLTYLDQNWGVNAKEKFIEKLSEKIKQISSLPESCPISKK